MEIEENWQESIDDVRFFLKKVHTFLASETCQLDIQRSRRNENSSDSNSTINTLQDLNYNTEDVKNEVLSLTEKNYKETLKDKKRQDNNHYRVFVKIIDGREIYMKFKICNVNRIHLMSFHYANWNTGERPYQ